MMCPAAVHAGGAAQSRVRIHVDAALLRCQAAYHVAVGAYRAGHDAEASDAIERLDRAELRTVAAVLLAVRETPARFASPDAGRTQGPATPFAPFHWDTQTLLAAGTMHLSAASATGDDSGRAAFHADLAHILFAAAALRLAGEEESASRRGAIARGLLYLFDRNLVLAREHLSDVVKRWPGDPDAWLVYGTAIESESSSPYPVAAMTAPAAPSRAGPLRLDRLSAERASRARLLRAAGEAFERVLALDSSAVEARVRLAHVRSLEQDDARASVLLEQALAARPPAEWVYIACLMLGDINERAGRLVRARELYAQALTARPDGQSASLALSRTLHAAGDAGGASAVLERFFDGHAGPGSDPWWDYPFGRRSASPAILAMLREWTRR